MKSKESSDEEFYRRFEAYESETADEIIKRCSGTEKELRAVIEYLVLHRQALSESELERLGVESEKLVKKLQTVELEKIIEEVNCFKDILSFQKKLIKKND